MLYLSHKRGKENKTKPLQKNQNKQLKILRRIKMYYTNEITITMKDNATATKALEILRARLATGFDFDKEYRRSPSERMAEALEVEENTIIIPEEDGFHMPEHSMIVVVELMKAVAAELKKETFICSSCNVSDYDEAQIEAEYENETLKTETIYYPNGYTEYLCCEECGTDVVILEQYSAKTTYICPNCGEVVDMANSYDECKPEIIKKNLQFN